MYDAALRSIGLIRDAHLQGGFLVVLSDGTDHGSSATSDQVVAAARAAHVRIYTVGLESAAFDPDALSALAENGGGRYSQATSAGELQEIYRALGAELSNAHVVTYRSLASPGRRGEGSRRRRRARQRDRLLHLARARPRTRRPRRQRTAGRTGAARARG